MSVSRSVEWGDLKGMRKVETIEQMPDDYRETLRRLLYALASTEFASVEQHLPFINHGPTPEDRFIQAQVAADEAHQGMEDCKLLIATFGKQGQEMVEDLMARKQGNHLLAAFNVPIHSWAELTVFCASLDLVAWYHLRAFENSSFAPFARSMTSMVHEERFHASFGANRMKAIVRDPEYARLAGGSKAEIQESVYKWYPLALDTFGHSRSRWSDQAVGFGIKKWGNEELRQMFNEDFVRLLTELELDIPAYDYHRAFM